MRISDWSSDVCSSDLFVEGVEGQSRFPLPGPATMPLDTDDSRLIDDDFGHAIVIEILPQRPNSMIEDRRIAERRVHLRPSPYNCEKSKSLATMIASSVPWLTRTMGRMFGLVGSRVGKEVVRSCEDRVRRGSYKKKK